MTAGTRSAPRAAGAAARTAPSRARSWAGAWGAVFACSWGGNQFSPLLLMYEGRAHYSSLMVSAFLGVYVLGLAPALLISGALSDRHGRRPVMVVGVAAAVIGSALLAFGPLGPVFLAAGRLFSGFGVGIAMAVGSSWVKELSQQPFDPAPDEASGARRSSLAFTLGSGLGALVAGLIAQWGPAPEVLPFLIHIAVAAPFAFVVLAVPETRGAGAPGAAGPWWRQFRVPSVSHRRFTRVVAVAAPWLFGAAALGYGYLPTQLRGDTGSWGLLFATATTVVALGASSAIQPVAKRLHSAESARGLSAGVLILAVGIAMTVLAISAQSVWVGLAANVVIGAGMGLAMVSGLLEVQRIAPPEDLASLTGVFYALAYVGFLAPAVIAALAAAVPVTTILWVIVALAAASWALILTASTRHLPSPKSSGLLSRTDPAYSRGQPFDSRSGAHALRAGDARTRGPVVPAADAPQAPGREPRGHRLRPAGKKSPWCDAYAVKGVGLPAPCDLTTASTRSPAMTSPSTITGRVAEMHTAMAADPPNPVMGAFAREQAELAAGGVPAGIAPAGTVLPDAGLLDVNGAATTLYAAAGSGASVLVFYRGAWCPYCNIALSAYQAQLLPQLAERGVPLVAVSPQKPDGSLSMQQKNGLAFTVVSDPGSAIAGRLGILTRPSQEARAAQLQLGLDLAGVNADGTVTLPMPATVILDASRTVRWIDVHPDYTTRTEPQQVIDALDHLGH